MLNNLTRPRVRCFTTDGGGSAARTLRLLAEAARAEQGNNCAICRDSFENGQIFYLGRRYAQGKTIAVGGCCRHRLILQITRVVYEANATPGVEMMPKGLPAEVVAAALRFLGGRGSGR
jgi:hypothetical protein